MIRAVLFDAEGKPVKFLSSTVRQLNANLTAGGTWRPVPDGVDRLDEVPALASLDPHPGLVAPA